MSIVLSYPWWFLMFCIIVGLGYAAILYYRSAKNKGVNLNLVRLLSVFRFLSVALIAFFLLSPLIKNIFRKVEKPIILIIRDNSISIPLNADSTFYRNIFPGQMDNFASTLGDQYEVVSYNFGGELKSADKLDYSEKLTNISKALGDAGLRYINRNIGAIVLASDGLFNQGMNPVYNSGSIKAPIYTIALGDTSIKRDLLIKEVVYNKVVFLGNQFPIDVSLAANKLNGENTTLTVSHNGKTEFSKNFSINNNSWSSFNTAIFTADAPGTQRYRIAASNIKGEATYLNNYYDIFIDVIDSRQKILILTEFPHPDIAALQQTINQNKNYQSEIGLLPEFNKSLKSYSLIIMYQLPTASSNASEYIKQITTEQLPVIYILGNSTNVQAFNAVGAGIKIIGNRNNFDDVQGHLNGSFTLFGLSDNTVRYFPKLPPLNGPYGNNFDISPGTEILAYRKIGSTITNFPLISFTNINKHKIGVITGEGIWKWRNYDYADHQNHEIYNELISKMIQYVAVKEDKSFFRINAAQQFYENEPIVLFAELYNESYELINEPEIRLEITGEGGIKNTYTFSQSGSSYRVGLGILPVGEYQYKASVQYNGKTLTKQGRFIVKPIQLEALNTTANHDLLQKLSLTTGGKMYYPNQLVNLKEDLNNEKNITSIAYKQKQLKDLINFRWLFFIILLLLGVEWFIRKREGLA